MLAGLLGTVLCLTTVPVQAAQVNNDAVYTISSNSIEEWPQGPDLYSETAVLMDADTGAVLYNKGMDELRYPASITKVMTALLALEHSSVDDQVTFTEECLADQTSDSGNIGMQVGEVLTMKQCLLALMVQSANDVATQIAVHVSGSVAAFADLMNQRAQELGCVNTHFVNASGMPDENHYTTARDMALIFQEAIKNETFREIIATQSFTIEPTNRNPESRFYSTHHALVAQSAPEYYEGCFGGKTGVTIASRNTLVSGATRNGMTLIAVAMRADPGQVCQDHISLFNYGFDNFKKVEVSGGSVTIPNAKEVTDLEMVETVNGEVTEQNYYYKSEYFMGSGVKQEPTPEPEMLTPETEEVPQEEETLIQEEPENSQEKQNAEEKTKAEESLKQTYTYMIYILAGLIGVSLVVAVVSAVKKKKR